MRSGVRLIWKRLKLCWIMISPDGSDNIFGHFIRTQSSDIRSDLERVLADQGRVWVIWGDQGLDQGMSHVVSVALGLGLGLFGKKVPEIVK